MKYLPLRIWFLVSSGLALAAVIVRLVWEITYTTSAPSLAIIIMVILVILGVYALFIYLTIRPGLRKLKSRPVMTGGVAVFTFGLGAAIFHFIRFVPSPEASPFLSVVIAVLLLLAAISAYLLLLRVVWAVWKGRGS